jgi:hypothetical protein
MPKTSAKPRRSRNCTHCGYPKRVVWPPRPDVPELIEEADHNWLTLRRCDTCGALWVEMRHEPYAAFAYTVVWPSTKDDFIAQAARDEGAALHDWHERQLLDYEPRLTKEDWDAILNHRARSLGRDPYNRADQRGRRTPRRRK